MARKIFDDYGIPTLSGLRKLPHSEFTEEDEHLGRFVKRRLTPTEKSAAESMASEHASYGSSRFYLKTALPVSGPNHIKAIGDEAASAACYVDSHGRTITISYSSESHNSPSYVCAHPGAATGTGGNERDNIVNTATRVDAVYEARRQCHPEHNPMNDPVKQHTDETTKGIGDYANAMGIPHGDGSIKYHPGFTGNNIVNVMAVSVAEKERLMTNKVPAGRPGDYVAIYVGKASDATGIGGTKFASQAIDMTNTDLNEKAVQDPDPHLQEALSRGIEKLVDKAMREGWKGKVSMKDMGAAGLLCSTLEQLHGRMGVVINGDVIPQNAPRNSIELLEAETQERFMIYVHRKYAQAVLDIFNNEIGLPHINKGACARIIGHCNSSGRYVFVRSGQIDVDLPPEEFASGPLLYRHVKEPERQRGRMPKHNPLHDAIDKTLDSMNFKSDAYVYDHYDNHVRSTHIVNRGEGCATLRTHPLLEGKVGYSVSFDSNAVIGLLDPKLQAEDSFVRGAYRMAAMGCSVIGLTNNANYGRTTLPEEMWEFVEGQRGVARACYNWELEPDYEDMIRQDEEVDAKFETDKRRHVTVCSGNCSLNKANANTGTAIPPTAILGLVGWTNEPSRHATWGMKSTDSVLYLIGKRQAALGATDYLQASFGPDCLGNRTFRIDYKTSRKEVGAIISAVRSGYVASANVIEEGGLCNAVGEMVANASQPVDVSVYLDETMGPHKLNQYQKLFSESMGMVLQVSPEYETAFIGLCRSRGVTPYVIGRAKTADAEGLLRFVTATEDTAVYAQRAIREIYGFKLERKLNYASGGI